MSIFKKAIRCPNCQERIEKKPTRKTKCPHCEKPIYVRHGELVTEEQKVKHDDMDLFRFTEEEYRTKQSELLKKFGSMPSHSDTIWGTANGKIPMLMGQKAFCELSDLYMAMAKFMHGKGKDFIELFKTSKKYQLLHLKEGGLENVLVEICGVASPSCQIFAEKKMPLDEAIKTMPIPNSDCLNKNRKEFYLCMYCYSGYEFGDGHGQD